MDKATAILDGLFRFKIHDLVEHIGTPIPEPKKEGEEKGSWSMRIGRNIPDVKLVVVERRLQQCHGGIQRFYDCRMVGDNGVIAERGQLFSLTEGEVRAFAPRLANT